MVFLNFGTNKSDGFLRANGWLTEGDSEEEEGESRTRAQGQKTCVTNETILLCSEKLTLKIPSLQTGKPFNVNQTRSLWSLQECV